MRDRERTMCHAKARYESRWEAKQAVLRIRKHHQDDVHAYRCPYCDFYHVGHGRHERRPA
jgi:hypothetical protein